MDVYPKKARVSGSKRRVPNKTIAGRRRILLLNEKPARMSVKILEIAPQYDHEISCHIATSIRGNARLRAQRADTCATSRVDVEPQLDIARYHMIELQINLMIFSAVSLSVTIFLARVVVRTRLYFNANCDGCDVALASPVAACI